MKHIYITLHYFTFPLCVTYICYMTLAFFGRITQICYMASVLCTCVTYFCYMPSQLLKWNTYILHNFATLGVKHICVTRLCTSIKICAKTKCKHFMNQSGTCWGQRTKSAEKAFEHRRMPLLKGFFEKRSKTAYLDCRGVLRYNIGEKRALKAKNRLFC